MIFLALTPRHATFNYMKKISVAVDFSDVMPNVLEEAIKLARLSTGTIHLIHVMEVSPAYGMYGFSPEEIPMVGPSPAELSAAVKRKMGIVAAKVREEGVEVVEVVLEGNPLEEILRYIDANGMDVLVVGTHGHGFLATMLLGSVADGAVRRSKIPVLVVPGKKK